MPEYLLDTHTLIWMLEDNTLIPLRIKNLITKFDSQLSISIISIWEIVIKTQIGKLVLKFEIQDIFEYCERNKIQIRPVTINYLLTYQTLPLIHRDPFDRMIIATAISDKITIVSKDAEIAKYQVNLIW